MTDEQKPRIPAANITELKRILGPMTVTDGNIDAYASLENMDAIALLITYHADLLLAYESLPYVQGYYDSLMAETTELREAMFEPGVKEMLGFGDFVLQPFAKVAEFLRAEAKRRAEPVIVSAEMADALKQFIYSDMGSPSDISDFDAQGAINAMFAAREAGKQ